ncbi:TOMM precursor leader peptide-binding protein [Streptomyces sp. NBC_01221]|uniref:TOMM precursor leader peptide-binding protein n=1 Tax=unclassified Streptomyces TaxID=2593676 RepID=UPI00225463B5|nr:MULTISPECIES: TOMM precursor leader peptide-binding protein [unclassified Streptomyces]MCX4790845.1 TOMM precursor leader peptide-binding protein [Streptomyces sp. NBC_01221]MCX4793425.1 TOMM precursor leader peptide-binding protein [Streptomyces sp. NBC_01242]WSJ34860.1 TOMM precursor leader peptide-binding protein [Streptomyces sp. NBC_01321]WSU20374.1 TOMM precursor leader peptide-binding protein [Streptomyces sp. NBC_01108]
MNVVSNAVTTATVLDEPRVIDVLRGHLAGRVGPGVTVDVGVLGLPARTAPSGAPAADGLVYPVRLYGGTVLMGPLYRADGTSQPCGRCLDRRWLALRPVEERRPIEEGADVWMAGDESSLTPFALEQIAQIVHAETADGDVAPGERRVGRIVELRTRDLTVSRHDLIADSECEWCATPVPDTAEGATLPLSPRPKPSPITYRGASAADLTLPTTGLVNEVCGALASAARRVYQCSATLPVSGYFRVRSKYDYHEMWWSGQSQSSASSERYGILEGLERYAGQFPRAKQPKAYASYSELAPDALDPTSMGSYRPEFYIGHNDYYQPYHPDTPTHWVWGYSFSEQRPLLVPEQFVFYLDRRPDRKFVQECSNGCASGSSVEEALLHGMLELIERDAFLLCWYGSAKLPEIDQATVVDEEVQFVLDRVARLGYRMRLFDMRVDIPVPAVMAVAERLDGGLGRLCFAAGASLDPVEAVRAAIAETASYIPGMDERVEAKLPDLRAMVTDYNRVHELTHHALLYGLPEMASACDFLLDAAPPRSVDELYGSWLAQRPESLDLADDARFVMERLRDAGSDVVAVDQTCPEQDGTGIRTLSVLAPGLVPIDFGWERQRALAHPRLRAYLDGELAEIHARDEGFGPTGLNRRPHPFP